MFHDVTPRREDGDDRHPQLFDWNIGLDRRDVNNIDNDIGHDIGNDIDNDIDNDIGNGIGNDIGNDIDNVRIR